MTRRNAVIVLAALVACACAGIAIFALRAPAPSYSLATIERADTPDAQERGLSGRESIPDDYGMLFSFPVEGDYAFWMKDMLVPIDIIWLSDDGTVISIEGGVSPSTYPTQFHPPAPVRYVLETRAGEARDRGWAEGTRLDLPLR